MERIRSALDTFGLNNVYNRVWFVVFCVLGEVAMLVVWPDGWSLPKVLIAGLALGMFSGMFAFAGRMFTDY